MKFPGLNLLAKCLVGLTLGSLLFVTGLVPLHLELPSATTARGVASNVLLIGGFIGLCVSLALKHME